MIGADTQLARSSIRTTRRPIRCSATAPARCCCRPGDREQGLLAYTLGADGSGADLLVSADGRLADAALRRGIRGQRQHYLKMDGRPVFKWAVRLLVADHPRSARRGELALDDVNLVVLHQANVRILDAAVEDLGICSRAKW